MVMENRAVIPSSTPVTLEEFRWNFKRLLREGFPDGIPLHNLEELYRHWLRKTVTPGGISPGALDWATVFKTLPILKQNFEVVKKDQLQYVRTRKGPETSPQELTAVLYLANYSSLLWMKSVVSGERESTQSPDSTIASSSRATTPTVREATPNDEGSEPMNQHELSTEPEKHGADTELGTDSQNLGHSQEERDLSSKRVKADGRGPEVVMIVREEINPGSTTSENESMSMNPQLLPSSTQMKDGTYTYQTSQDDSTGLEGIHREANSVPQNHANFVLSSASSFENSEIEVETDSTNNTDLAPAVLESTSCALATHSLQETVDIKSDNSCEIDNLTTTAASSSCNENFEDQEDSNLNSKTQLHASILSEGSDNLTRIDQQDQGVHSESEVTEPFEEADLAQICVSDPIRCSNYNDPKSLIMRNGKALVPLLKRVWINSTTNMENYEECESAPRKNEIVSSIPVVDLTIENSNTSGPLDSSFETADEPLPGPSSRVATRRRNASINHYSKRKRLKISDPVESNHSYDIRTAERATRKSKQKKFSDYVKVIMECLSNSDHLEKILLKPSFQSVIEVPTDWMAFAVQSNGYEGNILSRGYYMCNGEGKPTLRFNNSLLEWVKPKFRRVENNKLRLPAWTFVYGEYVVEHNPSSFNLNKIAFHIMDAAVVNGNPLYDESFTSRQKFCADFFNTFRTVRGCIPIAMKPCVPLLRIRKHITSNILSQRDSLGATFVTLKDTPIFDNGSPRPIRISGLLFVQSAIDNKETGFVHAMKSRYFWQWKSELSICSENILFADENSSELVLWDFLEHFRISGAPDCIEDDRAVTSEDNDEVSVS